MTTIYLADPNIRAEQIEAIRVALPAGWSLTDSPQRGGDFDRERRRRRRHAHRRGTSLRLVARLDKARPPLPKHRWTWSICPIRRWWAWPNMLCC
ncbi:MAG: hypothetical protein R2873_03995 [Caldilineaceae bacterium]